MSSSSTYLQDVLTHFQNFIQARGVRPDDVHVRFFLADGSSYFVRGLRIAAPSAAGGFGLIEGVRQQPNDALTIREQHIVKVELALNPREPTSIGLHSEAG